MLPAAVGVALSPLPIVAVVLMLVTPRGRANGLAFVVGWLLGLGIVGAIVLVASSDASTSSESEPATWVSWLQLLLGLLLVLAGVREWRSRPQGAETPPTPKWMGALDTFAPPKAAGAGLVLSAANPKNLLLAVAGAVAIAQTGIPGSQQAVAWIVFVLIATVGVAAPVAIAIVMGERARDLLDRLKDWLAFNNAVIMGVLMLVIGAKLIGDAISGFSS
jgi:threonine/homoserine/homoserine lactone efflux protein